MMGDNLVPPHANFSLQLEKSLGSSRLTNKFLSSKNTFIIKTLKLEIRDACDRMRYAFSKMYSLSHLVCRCIPTRICNSFLHNKKDRYNSFSLKNDLALIRNSNGFSINNKKSMSISNQFNIFIITHPHTLALLLPISQSFPSHHSLASILLKPMSGEPILLGFPLRHPYHSLIKILFIL